jgi:uncharacterized protein (TIGR02466 family)
VSDAFTPIPLFAFPLFVTIVGGAQQHKDALVKEILDLERKHPGIRRSNRNAWHSGEEFLASRSEGVAFVLQNATNYARQALGRYYQGWATSELKMGSYWANVLRAGGFNAPHHHHPTHWSGAYYVQVPQVGNGQDDLSGMIEFLNPTPWNTLGGTAGNFGYGPKEGMVMLFPASLVHYVHPHASEQPRISIAFNFSVVPKPRGK